MGVTIFLTAVAVVYLGCFLYIFHRMK
jgi:hypothetical protein